MFARQSADYFVSGQSFPVQPFYSLLETGVEGGDRANRSPAAKIRQQGPQQTQSFTCQAIGQISRPTASPGKKFIYEDS